MASVCAKAALGNELHKLLEIVKSCGLEEAELQDVTHGQPAIRTASSST